MYVNRRIESILTKSLESFPVVAVTGPRQTGKSTLIRTHFEREYKYITFDDPLIRERALDDPKFFIDNLPGKVILDEIQHVPQLLSYIKIKVDENRNKKGRYILTGSQQFTMMKEVSETLAGRIALLTLLPFSFPEISEGNPPVKEFNSTEAFFRFATLNGLYPEPGLNEKMEVKLWYGSYLQTYLERDIRSIYNLGNLRDFTRFLRLLASNCSQVMNLSAYSRNLGVSSNTIRNWLSILEASQIIYILNPYYKNLGKRITKSPKIYWTDLGLVCYLSGINSEDQLFHGPMAGPLFENLIIQETIKHFYNQGVRPNLYYLRTSNGLEVDLIIEQNNLLHPYEIKLSKSPRISMTKNLKAFGELFSSLNPSNGKLISLSGDSFPVSQAVDGISFFDYVNSLDFSDNR